VKACGGLLGGCTKCGRRDVVLNGPWLAKRKLHDYEERLSGVTAGTGGSRLEPRFRMLLVAALKMRDDEGHRSFRSALAEPARRGGPPQASSLVHPAVLDSGPAACHLLHLEIVQLSRYLEEKKLA